MLLYQVFFQDSIKYVKNRYRLFHVLLYKFVPLG